MNKNKFNIGDKVFLIENNEIQSLYVYGLYLHFEGKLNFFHMYALSETPECKKVPTYWYTENRLFASKEELIKTL